MKQKIHELDLIQRWMQAVIMNPGGVEEGIISETSRCEIDVTTENIESVICRSRSLTSIERLNVYGNAYYARLLDCLTAEFPALSFAIGEELFQSFAFDYLQDYPSTSYTLNKLSTNFPKYLRETRPTPTDDDDGQWMQFVIDLATLERLYSDVFDGPGWEGKQTLRNTDFERFRGKNHSMLVLKTVPCFRLTKFDYPVHEYASAVRRKEEPPLPEPIPTYLAISRIEYRVRRWSLSELQYDLLTALNDSQTLEEAIQAVVKTHQPDRDSFAENLQNWFKEWTDASFFESASVAPNI